MPAHPRPQFGRSRSMTALPPVPPKNFCRVARLFGERGGGSCGNPWISATLFPKPLFPQANPPTESRAISTGCHSFSTVSAFSSTPAFCASACLSSSISLNIQEKEIKNRAGKQSSSSTGVMQRSKIHPRVEGSKKCQSVEPVDGVLYPLQRVARAFASIHGSTGQNACGGVNV